ncbi:hypothetical protein A6A05_05030 [Magnetospirillum moscoviense]|uniref:Uncharacterized protein n=2 Tax=Magnetospirillum moscoviense TaxID=1437059 RepID=A0A178M4N0_9PROT|nr:hypothetical protein [Alphaproteobacteria bacterium]OAN43710.1 hypothetical protein A6A05_05030 [Magnetospirillum moscoviense]
MVANLRLMPGYDPDWRDKVNDLAMRYRVLGGRKDLTADEAEELSALRGRIDDALNTRFRTTLEYRDFYFARARALLEAEGIEMPLPNLPADATQEQIDDVLSGVWAAVEVTNSETF